MSITADQVVEETSAAHPRWLTRERVLVYSAALLACQIVLIALWVWAHYGAHVRGVPPLGIDYRVYWSASHITLHHDAIEVFNGHRLFAVEKQLLHADMVGNAIYAPWAYPPTFQLVISPLALAPYGVSYILFVLVNIACFCFACTRVRKAAVLPWISLIAFPGVWIAMVCGQNSLLTLALAAGALSLLERRPVLAGVCAGLMVIKPQLAFFLPLAFLCGRHWRALGAAVVTGGLFCLVSALILGLPVWLQFFENLSHFKDTWVENSTVIWRAMPTIFALARRMGASIPVAYVIHAVVAVPAILVAMVLWARRARFELRAAAAAVVTLLAQPYLIYYDLAWLALPVIYLYADDARRGTWNPAERAIIALAWLLPIQGFLAVMIPAMGQWGTVVLPALLIVVLRRANQ